MQEYNILEVITQEVPIGVEACNSWYLKACLGSCASKVYYPPPVNKSVCLKNHFIATFLQVLRYI